MASTMWNARVIDRAPINSLRDPSSPVAGWTHVMLRGFVNAKVLPAKALKKSSSANDSTLDVLLPLLRERKSFSVQAWKKAPMRARALGAWLERSLRAELGEEAPEPLERVTIVLEKAHPEAAVTDDQRFAVRLVAGANSELFAAYPTCLEPTFDVEAPLHPLVFATYYDPKRRRARTLELTVLSEPRYLVLPETFDSTAW